MTENNETAPAAGGSILVVGGGISGLTAALEAAEVGYEVFLVEKEASLGGRVAQLNKYFPKLCPPTCGLEINYRRIKDNPNIRVLTLTEVETVDGSPGAYEVLTRNRLILCHIGTKYKLSHLFCTPEIFLPPQLIFRPRSRRRK